MRLCKILLALVLVAGFSLTAFSNVLAQSQDDVKEVVILFFWGDGCPHCLAEKPFLEELEKQNPQVVVKDFEVYNSSENRDFLLAMGEAMKFEVTGVPVTIIGEKVWVGFGDTTKVELSQAVEQCLLAGCPDPAQRLGLESPVSAETGGSIPGIVW